MNKYYITVFELTISGRMYPIPLKIIEIPKPTQISTEQWRQWIYNEIVPDIQEEFNIQNKDLVKLRFMVANSKKKYGVEKYFPLDVNDHFDKGYVKKYGYVI